MDKLNLFNINTEEYIEEQRKKEDMEKNRIASIACPVCKSNLKKRFIQSESNGILGPGYHSHTINDYYICQSCGVHYSDLNGK